MCTLRVTFKNAQKLLYSFLFSHVLASRSVTSNTSNAKPYAHTPFVYLCAASATLVRYKIQNL